MLHFYLFITEHGLRVQLYCARTVRMNNLTSTFFNYRKKMNRSAVIKQIYIYNTHAIASDRTYVRVKYIP